MLDSHSCFSRAIAMIDAVNSEDPNLVAVDGKQWPKELLYAHRMLDMLQRFKPNTDDAMKLAIRAQHIQRWQYPREGYPMNRIGYLQWRKDLYKFHANRACELLSEAGCDEKTIERVKDAVAKKGIKENPDTQLLEDIADLVFIEHYLAEFADKHPEYDEQRWLEIIGKTWKKMSQQAQRFTLRGGIKLPEELAPLILKAVL